MSTFTRFFSDLFAGSDNVAAVDRAREVLRDPTFSSLMDGEDEVMTVRRLRQQVRALGLFDAATLVREARSGR